MLSVGEVQAEDVEAQEEEERVACLPGCHWGPIPDEAGPRGTPLAIHAEGCPHYRSRYVEHTPAPVSSRLHRPE